VRPTRRVAIANIDAEKLRLEQLLATCLEARVPRLENPAELLRSAAELGLPPS